MRSLAERSATASLARQAQDLTQRWILPRKTRQPTAADVQPALAAHSWRHGSNACARPLVYIYIYIYTRRVLAGRCASDERSQHHAGDSQAAAAGVVSRGLPSRWQQVITQVAQKQQTIGWKRQRWPSPSQASSLIASRDQRRLCRGPQRQADIPSRIATNALYKMRHDGIDSPVAGVRIDINTIVQVELVGILLLIGGEEHRHLLEELICGHWRRRARGECLQPMGFARVADECASWLSAAPPPIG